MKINLEIMSRKLKFRTFPTAIQIKKSCYCKPITGLFDVVKTVGLHFRKTFFKDL